MNRKSRRQRHISGLLPIVAWLLLCTLWHFLPQAAEAEDIDSAFTTAQLDLQAQVAVEADDPVVNISDPGTPGEFDVTVDFTVEANISEVNMFAEVTDFYFEGDPTDQFVEPIHLVDSAGCEIDPEGANPLNGNIAAFTGEGDVIDGFPSRKTETIGFQSTANDHMFSHPVAVTATWDLEPMKPAGQYTAKIKLTCIAVPD